MNSQIELPCFYIFQVVHLRSIGAYSGPLGDLGEFGKRPPLCNMIIFWLDQGLY